MKQFIEQNKVMVKDAKWNLIEVIPVLAIEQLFSREGAKEAMDALYGVDNNDFTPNDLSIDAFTDAYNLQQVKIEALKKEVEELRKEVAHNIAAIKHLSEHRY